MYARGMFNYDYQYINNTINIFLVVILSVRGALVRKFMLAAHALGMTKGDWIFLDVEIFQVSRIFRYLKKCFIHKIYSYQGSYWGDHDWKAGDSEDYQARKAYEALLRVSLLQPTSDKFQDFADKVKERSLRDYNYTISEGEEVKYVQRLFLGHQKNF